MARGSGSLLAAIMLVALSGCGTESSSTAAVQPAAESSSPTVSAEATTSVPEQSAAVPSVADRVRPVAAAKLAGSYPDGYVDLSPLAQQNFHAWMVYEVQTPADSHGDSIDITSGVSACEWRSRNLEVTRVMELLQSEMGYNGTGAASVLASALRALCPLGDLGFRTNFDIDVEKFQNAMALSTIRFDSQPTYDKFGNFMKAACQGMTDPAVGGQGIYDHMVGTMQANPTQMLQAGDQNALDVMINLAVTAGCYSVHAQLPARIQQAS
jgi:hypothetical protein